MSREMQQRSSEAKPLCERCQRNAVAARVEIGGLKTLLCKPCTLAITARAKTVLETRRSSVADPAAPATPNTNTTTTTTVPRNNSNPLARRPLVVADDDEAPPPPPPDDDNDNNDNDKARVNRVSDTDEYGALPVPLPHSDDGELHIAVPASNHHHVDDHDDHVDEEEEEEEEDDEDDDDLAADDGAAAVFSIVDTPTALDTEGRPFTAYVVAFQARDGLPRSVVRRYNQFAALHKALCSFFPKHLVPRLTSKRFINNRSAETVEKRRVKLMRYLNELAAKPSLLLSEMVETFLYNTKDIELAGSSNSIRHNERHADSSPNSTLAAASGAPRRAATPNTLAAAAAATTTAAAGAPPPEKNELMQRKMQEILDLQQKVSLEQQARRRATDSTAAPPAMATMQRDLSFSFESAVLMSPRRVLDDALERAASSRGRGVASVASSPADEAHEELGAVERSSSSAALAVAAAAAEMELRSGSATAAASAAAATGPSVVEAPLPVDADPATLCKALLLGRHAPLAEYFAALKSDSERAATTGKMRELLDEIRAAHERRICVAQRAVRRWLARRALLWRRNARRQRWDVANELLRTELSYVKGLAVLVFRYFEPLTAAANDKSAGLLNEADLRIVLGELFVADMYHANVALRDELQTCVAQWTHWACVGNVLSAHLHRFRYVYATYYANFDASNELLGKRLRSLDKFRQFCEQVQAEPECERLDLVSYLITPIQRLPRYALLIEQLIAATPPDHPDGAALARALVVARSLVTRINRHMQCRAQLLRWGADLGARGPQPFCSPLRFMLSRTDCKLAVKDDKWTDAVFAVLSDHVLVMHSKAKHRVVLPLHVCWARRFGADADADIELLSSAGSHLVRFASAERRDTVWADITDALSTLLDARISGDAVAQQERGAVDPLLAVFVHSRRPSSRVDVDLFDDDVFASAKRRADESERHVLVLRYGSKAVRQQPAQPQRAAPPLERTSSVQGMLSPRSSSSVRGAPVAPLTRTSSIASLTKAAAANATPAATNSPLSPRARSIAAAAAAPAQGSPALSRRPTREPTTLSMPIEARRQSTLLPPPPAGAPQKLMAVALFAFAPQRAGDLALAKGDIIEAVEVTPSGWWRGQVTGSATRGQFPATYVRPINFVLPPETQQQLEAISRGLHNATSPAATAATAAAPAAAAPSATVAPAAATPAPTTASPRTASPRAASPPNGADAALAPRATLGEQPRQPSQQQLLQPAPPTQQPAPPTQQPTQLPRNNSLRGEPKSLPTAPFPARPAPVKPPPPAAVVAGATPVQPANAPVLSQPFIKRLPSVPSATSGKPLPTPNLRTVLRAGGLLSDDEIDGGAPAPSSENLRPSDDDGI